ncbi:hypothetical protein ZIOFF_015005 [Zingiber officinale]|uniref:Myosin-12 n=1 Tax=Zingiber officinale TaxID=94328 RepID=A0A8J5HDP2_ZINOF|nr:hypothetical protein ZIOFF_015005 [Zingiber officinale]
MGTPVNIIVGSHVWVEDPEAAWIDGQVTAIKGGAATILTTIGKTMNSKAEFTPKLVELSSVTEEESNKKLTTKSNTMQVVANLSSIYPKDTEAPAAGVDDMTKLAYLHEPGVLQNLSSRYALNEIYTYTGNILIAVNPFQRLPHLYDVHMMEQYKGAAFGELNPHLFAVADDCYRAIINDHGSQSILVSGESGAGKTETTKMLMRYLAFMGGRSGTEGRTVEQQVLESNPVLEAFGNSKTVKNNNSSRFGKFVEIQFDKYGKISGAAVRTYLLERSRVCQVSDPERNYHCFYMLCSAPPEEAKKFKVADPRTFHYLNQTNCFEVANMDDAREYLETRKAMDIVGINQEDQDAIFRVVAAILHLGNINFAKGTEIDSSKLRDEKSLYHLKTAAELLMADEKALQDSLCQRVIVTPDGKITKLLDPESAALSRDALAKTVYSRLFDWIVDTINTSIGQDPDAKEIIGVLDIYGFESFKINSFEQLCINLTNEKLQQHFNQHVFKMEQEEYTKEEIDWSYVEFVDNQDVLDLIEKVKMSITSIVIIIDEKKRSWALILIISMQKPGGIIALLDEACMFPKSTHETFAQKMYQTYKNHKRFSKPKLARTAFNINHYAGDVTYQADLFLDKNKDYVVAEHQALLNASKCPFVANLIPPLPEEASKQSKFSSIGTRFKGVLEAIRISCAGYPTKRTFEEFVDRFGILAVDLVDSSDEKAACAAILERMGLKGYQIGKTKVFLRAGQMAELDTRRMEVLSNAARTIQRQIHTHLARKEFLTLRKASIQLQKLWRARLARKLYESMRRQDASIRIQKYARSHVARKSYSQLRSAAIVIQTGLKAMAARNEYRHKRRTKAAIIIQTQWRLYQARSAYKHQKKATLILQCLWRGRIGRKELRKLRMAARETGALKEAKDKLEKKVEELTWRLDVEKHMRIDIEEAKGKEITKLQSAIQEMHVKLNEAQEAIIREKEAARIAIEQAPPVIKEVPVVDNAKLDSLANRNNELEAELSIFRSKAEEFEGRYNEVQNRVEELLRDTEEYNSKISQMQEMIESLETNLSGLESENKVLRQQALVASSNEDLSDQIKSLESKISTLESENQLLRNRPAPVYHPNADSKTTEPPVIKEPATAPHAPALSKQKSLTDRQQENHDALIKCLSEYRRFENKRPSTACIVYKSLLQWHSFQAEKTNIFDRIIQTLRSFTEHQENVGELAYWISTTSTLLLLLQKNLKASSTSTTGLHRSRTTTVPLFSRMARNTRLSSTGVGISNGCSGMVSKTDDQTKIEAKYPALLFKQQLTAYVEKIYGIIRDSLKKEIGPFLTMCIQVRAKVPMMIISKTFSQVFAFINVQLFNSLLLRRECCSFSNAEFLKAGLQELEQWSSKTTEEFAGTSWDELQHIRQAVGFLVLHQKSQKSLEEITKELCPALSVPQIYRIGTMFWDDKYATHGTHGLSQEVIAKMRTMMTDDTYMTHSSFLLDDDSSISFSLDEISRSVIDISFSEVEPPPLLREKSGFQFLVQPFLD